MVELRYRTPELLVGQLVDFVKAAGTPAHWPKVLDLGYVSRTALRFVGCRTVCAVSRSCVCACVHVCLSMVPFCSTCAWALCWLSKCVCVFSPAMALCVLADMMFPAHSGG